VVEGKIYYIIGKYLICNWCGTDSIGLSGVVRASEVIAKDQRGANKGYQSDDVGIAW